MRLLVIGTGSIGVRHCRNLVSLGHDVVAWDADPGRLREVTRASGVVTADSFEEALAAKTEAALICTPPASHAPVAQRALDAGLHLFVEKPIAATVSDAIRLVAEAERRARLLAIGFNLRF
ncbi:MAG TPA: Gfo/Idh/MocA family oxidoreductase, partial [Candidatus Methylomirabilis sp.]|nr:Gfo/Idh/MocA family oxidoreductase [Candidatus Methylomirabilis sp.]